MRYKLKFDDDDYSWEMLGPDTGEDEPQEPSSARWLIVNHLNKHSGTRFGTEDLAEAIGIISEGTLRRELLGLFREGLIDREPNPKSQGGHSKGEPKHFYLVSS